MSDSAGIPIVKNGSAPSAPWTVVDSPFLVIGGDESNQEQQLHRVSSATRLPSGHIAVANDGTAQVFLFDTTGRRIGVLGGRGGGPGEFEGLAMLRLIPSAADTIIVEAGTPRRRKIAHFSQNGELVRELIASSSAPFRRGAWYSPVTSPEGHTFAVNEPLPTNEAPVSEVTRRQAHVVRIPLPDTARDTIAAYPGSTYFYADVGPRPAFGGGTVTGPRSIAPLFAAMTRLGGGGDPFRIAVGDQAFAAFDVYDVDGNLLRRVRWDGRGRMPQSRDIDLARTAYLNRLRSDPAGARRSLDVMPRTTESPVFGAIVVDRLGFIWVERYPLPSDDRSMWWIFDRDGFLVASAQLPDAPRLLEIGADYVIMQAANDMGVNRIEIHTLVRNSVPESDRR